MSYKGIVKGKTIEFEAPLALPEGDVPLWAVGVSRGPRSCCRPLCRDQMGNRAAGGTPLDENDLWIAATARALEAVVVTTDSDFQRVSGLQTADWTQ